MLRLLDDVAAAVGSDAVAMITGNSDYDSKMWGRVQSLVMMSRRGRPQHAFYMAVRSSVRRRRADDAAKWSRFKGKITNAQILDPNRQMTLTFKPQHAKKWKNWKNLKGGWGGGEDQLLSSLGEA